MEARAAFRETGSSKKALFVVVALAVALLLSGTGAFIIRAMSSSAAPAASHVVQGQDLAGGAMAGSAWNYSNQRHGTQSVEGPALTNEPAVPGPRHNGTQSYP